MTTIPFGDLRLAGLQFENPRKTSGLGEESIREFAIHIVRHGLMTPLLIAGGTVIAGQRRYRAIEMIRGWAAEIEEGAGNGLPEELFDLMDLIDDRARELYNVPVHDIGNGGTAVRMMGLAVADNVMRENMSSYEIAAQLSHFHDQGATGVELARLIGKSASYVSRKLSTWKNAGPELRTAWEAGELAEDAVQRLAELPHPKQVKALAGEIPKRGAANRPGIDTVKDVLVELEVRPQPVGAQLAVGAEARSVAYTAGVLDALRWVAGRQASEDFAKLVSSGT